MVSQNNELFLKGKFSEKCSELRRPKGCGELRKIRTFTDYKMCQLKYRLKGKRSIGRPMKSGRISFTLKDK
jgi:hypothetical protein